MSKKIFSCAVLVSILSLITVNVNAHQTNTFREKPFNANPDPNGEPWIVGGLPSITPKLLAELREIPELDLSDRPVQLPYKLNNAEQKYFRTIFNQSGACCSQAAGISYHLNFIHLDKPAAVLLFHFKSRKQVW